MADPSVIATQRLTVLPAGTIRIATGRASPYTDSTGKVWQASTGDDGGWPGLRVRVKAPEAEYTVSVGKVRGEKSERADSEE